MTAYPESCSALFDVRVKRAITPFFFDAETYLRFRYKGIKQVIDADIVPNILALSNYKM